MSHPQNDALAEQIYETLSVMDSDEIHDVFSMDLETAFEYLMNLGD